ncbi:MAG: MCE family protein [Alphaproteobacteria bacterium]|nr:MCE family protein [Alphaproteobacteria bacterium]
METKANYIAVGAFVLACMFGLVVTVLWLANAGDEVYSYYRVRVQGSVTGVGKGTLVRYNGIEAGRVVDFMIDPTDPKRVIVSITIAEKYDIAPDATAAIASQGLTGGSYMEILGGSLVSKDQALRHDATEDMANNPEIKWIPSTIEDLTNRVRAIGAKIDKVLNDENIRKFSEILAHTDTITATIAARSGDIDATLRNTNEATRNFAVAARDLHPTLLAAQGTLRRLDRVALDADQVVTGDGVAQLSALIADSRRLVTSLTKLSDELNREPTRVIFGDRRKGYTPK